MYEEGVESGDQFKESSLPLPLTSGWRGQTNLKRPHLIRPSTQLVDRRIRRQNFNKSYTYEPGTPAKSSNAANHLDWPLAEMFIYECLIALIPANECLPPKLNRAFPFIKSGPSFYKSSDVKCYKLNNVQKAQHVNI